MRDFKPATLVLFALALLAMAACRPGPDDEVEYLRREDSVIVQMLTVEAGASDAARRLAVPELTLYGDGTLIYKESATDGTRLLQTTLPDDAVLDVLEGMLDEGFLGFFYDQSSRNSTGPTAFLYAHTLDRANAVAIRTEGRPQEGLEEQSASVLRIIEELRSLELSALGASEPAHYLAEDYVMVTHVLDGSNELSEEIVSAPGSGTVLEALLSKSADPSLETLFGPSVLQPEQAPDSEVYLAPVLPFSENFPLFD